METVSKELIRKRFSKAAATYDQHAEAQRFICEHLVELLTKNSDNRFKRVLEIGCGSGGFTRLLKQRCQIGEWILNDLCASWEGSILPLFPYTSPEFLVGDAETLDFPGSFDLIASASALQWMKNLPLFFKKIATHLSPNGYFIFNTFAPGNLSEIKEITGIGLKYPTEEEVTRWLSNHFHVIYAETNAISLHFKHPIDVLKHLKYTGVTATSSIGWTREKQQMFCQEYERRFQAKDGTYTLTYKPLYILAQKRGGTI